MQYFSPEELKCKCGKCGSTGHEMNQQFMIMINELRHDYGKPLVASSAYRCPEYNNKVSKTGLNGPHTTGSAMDLLCRGEDAFILLKLALQIGFTGIGVQQKGDVRYLHVDYIVGNSHILRPRLWSY